MDQDQDDQGRTTALVLAAFVGYCVGIGVMAWLVRRRLEAARAARSPGEVLDATVLSHDGVLRVQATGVQAWKASRMLGDAWKTPRTPDLVRLLPTPAEASAERPAQPRSLEAPRRPSEFDGPRDVTAARRRRAQLVKRAAQRRSRS